ncbi:uncharacterized protein FIBRA_09487 [Fibroporia radiculosa]|uniref:Uncharacterized protein n=1 Tax=Fibroporia radiculosa TaxID=599839 RepID=J7S6K2_9APHY|nr:uncharacterized protein FIBRA_09487 [Fibroporia radiculosa]CCM07149.1 predicted protein [Fibroporia radiculosa]
MKEKKKDPPPKAVTRPSRNDVPEDMDTTWSS